jgi:hypothetical protein
MPDDTASGPDFPTYDREFAATLEQPPIRNAAAPSVLEFMTVLAEALQITDVVGSAFRPCPNVVALHFGKREPFSARRAASAVPLKDGSTCLGLDAPVDSLNQSHSTITFSR